MGLDRARGRGRGLEVAEPPISALSAANETVERGYYAPTTLSAIDADLATANIKNGITMFGFAGSADVHDISDATAIEAEVIAGETFYAVAGGIRTGTMPIVALDPAANAYPAGYHAGDVSLTAVDGDLVTGSIKFGIVLFGVAGHTNVRDVSDANALVGEVMNGRTFYAVGGARKTGTLATVALNPANNLYPAGYHVGNGGGLTAVDAQLVAANIANGIVIFGVTGTLVAGALGEDLVDKAHATDLTDTSYANFETETYTNSEVNTEYDLATITKDYDASSMAVGVAQAVTCQLDDASCTLRLYMDGVLVAESAAIASVQNIILVATRALSGSKICKTTLFIPGNFTSCRVVGYNGGILFASISVGSIKLV